MRICKFVAHRSVLRWRRSKSLPMSTCSPLVSQRRTAGVASDRELAQAEALLSQAKATVPLLAIILEAQLNRLDVLMGAQAGNIRGRMGGSWGDSICSVDLHDGKRK